MGLSVAQLSLICLAVPLTASAQVSATAQVSAGAQVSAAIDARISAVAEKVLHDTGVPSASVGVVQGGRIVYTRAFGMARLNPAAPATASMAYPIGSISKQFTAAAVLILEQQGKLSLRDSVSTFFPELTRAGDVKIINLLTHTSGYQDYAPQDYTIPAWNLPGDPLKVVHEFAGKPLDFEPGTQWQYSNTNFVLAALIVQKVSGEPFAKFLREQVLEPAHLEHVLNLNTERSQLKVTGYMRNALAPLRPAELEAPGWYFGDADLAMPVASLLQWDLTIINQSLLSAASYQQMETPLVLKNGKDSNYGLGIDVRPFNGKLAIEHSGEVGGFVSENIVFPDDRAAIAVLTNQEASTAASEIAQEIAPIVLGGTGNVVSTDAFGPELRTILTGLEKGEIDRSLLTEDCSAYFSAPALEDFHSSLAPLGLISSVQRMRATMRGGMTFDEYRVGFSGGDAILVTVYLLPNGKVEQLLVVGKA